jgi:hypothetical protein
VKTAIELQSRVLGKEGTKGFRNTLSSTHTRVPESKVKGSKGSRVSKVKAQLNKVMP